MRKSEVGLKASVLTKEEFSNEISSFVSLTKSEIDKLFPKKNDREELGRLIDIVRDAKDQNERKAKLLNNISSVADAATKLLSKSVPG